MTTYRDPKLSARLRFEELHDDAAREAPLRAVLARILGARIARAAFGVVGLAGALAIVEAAIAGRGTDRSGVLSMILLGSWTAAVGVWLLARFFAPLVIRRVLAAPALSGELDRDVARLGDRRRLPAPAELALAGAALPMAAVSLLAPLTLHLAFWALFVRDPRDLLGDFDPWIVYGLVLVGQAHVVLALNAWKQAQHLVAVPLGRIDRVGGAWQAVGVTVFASAFPGVVVFGVPPILTALTGALFVPALFAAMKRVIVAERTELAVLGLG